MRCLIVIALCFVLANASFGTKNRFHKLLKRYQQNGWENGWDQDDRANEWDQENRAGQYGLFGSDDLDNHIQDYVDQIRRERLYERDQCPRDMEDIMGLDDDELDTYNMEGMFRGKYTDDEDMFRGKYTNDEDMFRGKYTNDEEDMFRGNKYDDLEDTTGQYDDMEDVTRSRRFVDEDSEIGSPLLKEIKDANIKLTTRLYEESKNDKDDVNTVVSPLSVQLALAVLNSGARGNTRRQIARVIAGTLKTQERKQIFKSLVRQLKGFRNTEYSTGQRTSKINPVTGLFLTKTTRAQQMFVQQVKTIATVKQCSFSQKPQQCRQNINQWMAQKTQNKINRIVPQDAITDNTKMILVNALELKATWGPQMRRHVTKEAKFYPLDTKKVKVVEVMETEGRFKYYEDELVKIVGVPTKDQEMTLYAIVPKDKDGLTEVEKLHLQDSVQLKQLLEKTDKHVRRVQVQLPKFQIKHKIDVRRTLRKQGVTDAFEPLRADFSGITGVNTNRLEDNENMYESIGQRGETKLHLNKFIHQCTIKITENGITATTGSQVEETYEPSGRMGRRSGDWDSEEMGSFERMTSYFRQPTGENVIKANHAFAFVLKHNPTKQVIMVGRVIDAAQKKTTFLQQTINGVDQL
jgi:serpin B